MPIFSFRTTPLPSLRTYTIFSVVVLCVSVLLLRHHPDEEPPTHQVASNKPDNETENANSDESAVFSKWAVINISFCALLWLSKLAVKGVYGKLRVGEEQQVREKVWNFAFYRFVFVFGVISIQDFEELMIWIFWLSLLGFFMMWGQLVKMRSEYICQSPHTHFSVHLKLLATSVAVISSIALLFVVAYHVGYDYGVDHFMFMVAECLILALQAMHTMIKHGIYLYDESQPGTWENRAIYSYYIDFLCDVTVLAIDFLHHIHMMLWINIFLSVASLVIFTQLRSIYSELKKRYERHRNFMRVSQELETRFPLATKAELEECSDNCAICWDAMESARKLPCGHLFHLSCLRLWLEQDTTCPTCRVSLGHSQRPTELNNLAQDALLPPQQPQQIPINRNSVWEFDGTRYASWLPVFSVEVVRGQQRNIPSVDDMVQRVRTVLPHVPYNVVVTDLQQTGSVQQTINNLIEHTPTQVSVSNDQEHSTVRHRQLWTTTSGHSESGLSLSHPQVEAATQGASSAADVITSDENSQCEVTDQNELLHHQSDEDGNTNNSHSQARVTAQLRLPKLDESQHGEDTGGEFEVAQAFPTVSNEESRDAFGSSTTRRESEDMQQRRLLSLQAAERRLQQQQQ